MPPATTSRRPTLLPQWIALALAVVLLATALFGGFLGYLVTLPAVAVLVVGVVLAVLGRGSARALGVVAAAVAALAAAVSVAFLVAGSFAWG